MEYLNRVLGIHVIYKDDTLVAMPNFIHTRYRTRRVTLDGIDAFFLYPKAEMDTIDAIKKHIDLIKKATGLPVVLVPECLTYRQKEYLLREKISFIVDGKQIYLPFMAVYLQQRCDGERQSAETMLPSAQLLLLYYIYHGCKELLTSEASDKLDLTPTSISRASKQLEEMDLLRAEKRGVQKVLLSEKNPEEMFASAKDRFRNPVKRVIYVPKAEVNEKLLISGYQALSEYSMLNQPNLIALASDSISAWEGISSKQLQSAEDQYAMELWRYDPKKLSDDEYVDRLSLAISLFDDRDERIEESVEEMLAKVWKNINGKRN